MSDQLFSIAMVIYIIHDNVSVETRPPKLHNLLQFSPRSIVDILWASPLNFSRFYDTRISSNRSGVQTSSLLTLIHPSATDLWKRIPERIASSVNNSPSLVLLETDLQRKINQKISAHPEALKARAFLIPTRGLTWYITKVNIFNLSFC